MRCAVAAGRIQASERGYWERELGQAGSAGTEAADTLLQLASRNGVRVDPPGRERGLGATGVADRVVTAAVATGRIPPWRADYWRGQIAQGGTAGAGAVMQLLQAVPVGGEVAAAWRGAAPEVTEEERTWDAMYGLPRAAAEAPSHEVVHDGNPDPVPAHEGKQTHAASFGWHAEWRHTSTIRPVLRWRQQAGVSARVSPPSSATAQPPPPRAMTRCSGGCSATDETFLRRHGVNATRPACPRLRAERERDRDRRQRGASFRLR